MTELILKTILEGIGLGALLVLVCAVGIRGGRCRHGASVQPGGAGAVRAERTYDT